MGAQSCAASGERSRSRPDATRQHQFSERLMTIENDHLVELRASYDAMRDRSGDPRVIDEAIRTLLRVAIAHHESALAKIDDTVFNAGAFDPPRT